LVWEPEEAKVAQSQDLAYSWGYSSYTPAAGEPPISANYVSIWRKQPDGRWKWVIDLGVLAPPKTVVRRRDAQ
jgi:ketosteroid isomerase-like protein